MTRNILILFYIIVPLLAACKPKLEEPHPPDIIYGQENCASCGMVIDDARFASATLLTSGEYRKFDDIREMLVYHMEHPEDQVIAWFVHDYQSERWLRGETAYYVLSTSIITPMGGGIVAFAELADAQNFASEKGGAVYKFDEIRAKVHAKEHP